MLTIRRVLLDDLHGPRDAGLLAVGVVEEGQLALLHGAEVVAGRVGADSCSCVSTRHLSVRVPLRCFHTVPRLWLGPGRQIINGELDVDAILEAGLGLGL